MNLNRRPLILASGSPRRRELLGDAGYSFDVWPPAESAESGAPDSLPVTEYVVRLARQKAADVRQRMIDRAAAPESIILACDTVAYCGGSILGKPDGEDDARRMLTFLSGREHQVYSGLCLWPLEQAQPRTGVAETTLRMAALSSRQLDEYLASGAWQGKAGAFGYQDRHGWLSIEQGSESNVVGLPLELLEEMLAEMK